MRVSAMMDQRKTIETILRHLNLWSGLPVFKPSRSPPAVIPKHREAEACIASIRISNNAVPTAIFAESPGRIPSRSSIKGARVFLQSPQRHGVETIFIAYRFFLPGDQRVL